MSAELSSHLPRAALEASVGAKALDYEGPAIQLGSLFHIPQPSLPFTGKAGWTHIKSPALERSDRPNWNSVSLALETYSSGPQLPLLHDRDVPDPCCYSQALGVNILT